MLPLFDMLQQAQGGEAFQAIARQFELSQKQAREAVEALMPAFSEGLKRNAADPYGLGSFLTALSTGQHQKYFEDAARAFSPQGMQEGQGILKHLFATPELGNAIAQQAAAATGIGQKVFSDMLPGLAAMLMGGLYKQASGQMPGAGFPQGNPFGAMVEQMMRQGAGMAASMGIPNVGGMPGATGGQAAGMFDNPFARMMQDYVSSANAKAGMDMAREAMAQNPFMRMFEAMMGDSGNEAPKKENPSGRARTPYDDLFGDMFEAGSRHREEYTNEMTQIFDRFVKGISAER